MAERFLRGGVFVGLTLCFAPFCVFSTCSHKQRNCLGMDASCGLQTKDVAYIRLALAYLAKL